jgi:predicted transcriptional regulator
MPSGKDIDRFYDMLFELSNDIRHKIMMLLVQKPERMTQIARVLELTSPEVSRHLTRLTEAKLIEKNADNFYNVTNFGEYLLNSLVDLEFMVKHRDYFIKHSAVNIPIRFQKRMSEISRYKLVNNFMEFLSFINEKIKTSQEYIWLYIDQYPILSTESMLNAVERGVNYRIIEQSDLSNAQTIFEKKYLFSVNGKEPKIEIKKHERKDAYLFISDKGSAIAFPTRGGFDYTGFIQEGNNSRWIKELFEYYWSPAPKATKICTLCSSPIREKPLIEAINGIELVFDTTDCIQTYKQLKQIYGKRFE